MGTLRGHAAPRDRGGLRRARAGPGGRTASGRGAARRSRSSSPGSTSTRSSPPVARRSSTSRCRRRRSATALAARWPDRDARLAGLRGADPAPARPGAAARPVAPDRPDRRTRRPRHGSASPMGTDADPRAAHPPLPRGVRAGDAGRRPDLVVADRRPRGPRTDAADARDLPRRGRPRAVRPARRADRGSRTSPAPVRFLPQYDNVFLSHDDRSRISGVLAWGLDVRVEGRGPRRRRDHRGVARPPRGQAGDDDDRAGPTADAGGASRPRRGGRAARGVPRPGRAPRDRVVVAAGPEAGSDLRAAPGRRPWRPPPSRPRRPSTLSLCGRIGQCSSRFLNSSQ